MLRRTFLAVSLPAIAALDLGLPTAVWAKARAKRRRAPRPIPWLVNGRPNVQAAGSLVVDLENDRTLYSRRPDQERPIASISKLAAMLVVMDRSPNLAEITTIARADVEAAKGGAKSRLLLGMTVSNLDLLHAALLGSDNRAVIALGRAVKLSLTAFAQAMNDKVKALGLLHTRFREPTGLSRENVSTPRETIRLLSVAMADKTLGPIVARQEYDAHPVSCPPLRYNNTCRPANRRNAQILGGKTGFNDYARYCLVIAARIDGRRIAMSFLGTEGELTRFADFGRVTDWIVTRKPRGENPTPVPTAAAPAPAPLPVDPD